MQRILIRPRTQIVEDNEEPSNPVFVILKKHNYNCKIIPKLERQNGKFMSNQFEILDDAKIFNEGLYSNKDNLIVLI